MGTNRTPAPDRSARASSGQLGWWSLLSAALGFLSVSAAPLLPQGAPRSAGALTLIGSARARGEASSGDSDPTDGRHQTFFQVLPTPQPHARFPFHNLMNLQDAWVSLTLRPASRVTLRSDLHTLRLTERSDLWYLGGGAFDDQSFGYVGRASEGGRHLADVWDLSVDVRLGPQWSLGGFVAWAKGANVIRSIYGPGDVDGSFGYLEVNYRP